VEGGTCHVGTPPPPPIFLLNRVDILLAQTHLAAIFCSDNEYQTSKKNLIREKRIWDQS
jgi:hypothetical protein